tara:strand:+ start:277 stop:801 length:525 start_codon:yes stop_codon:yes gene_type:complete
MEKSVVDTKNIIVENINNLFEELEDFSKELDIKFKNMNNMKTEIDQKHQDINSFKKVSFIANMNKQLEDKNQMIELLEKRILSLQLKNEKLNNKLKEFNSELIVETEDDYPIQEKNDDIWLLKEFDGVKYLFNSETKKVHSIDKNESPGDIIGRITSKDKFKKYNQPKEYIQHC